MTASPPSAMGLRNKRCSTAARGGSAAWSMTSTITGVPGFTLADAGGSFASFCMADPRVEESVQHVDHEIDQHKNDRENYATAHHDGQVALGDRAVNHEADAGNLKDRFSQ